MIGIGMAILLFYKLTQGEPGTSDRSIMMDRKLITPAEATVLLAPATSTATKCIQAGLLSLLGAERIALEKKSSPFKQSALVLKLANDAEHGFPSRHLLVLEQALLDYGKGRRLVSSEVLHALQKRFGYDLSAIYRTKSRQDSSRATCSSGGMASGSGYSAA